MFFKNKGLLMSFLMLALILPVVLGATLGSGNFRLTTSADEKSPLRIWMEPSSITAKAGQTFEIKIMAAYEEVGSIIPEINFMLEADNGLFVENKKVSFVEGFNGSTQIGTVKVKGLRPGLNKIWILNNSVDTTLADLNIVTDGVSITVRE